MFPLKAKLMPKRVISSESFDFLMDSAFVSAGGSLPSLAELGWCPCRSYIRLLLGKHCSTAAGSSFTKVKTFYHDLFWSIRFVLPILIFMEFFIDFGDWLMHDENLTGLSSRHVRGEQSYIITVFAYLRSQFTCFVALNSTLIFIKRAPKFVRCMDALVELRRAVVDAKYRSATRSTFRLKCAYAAIGYVCLCSLLRLIYYLYSTYEDRASFWNPTKYFLFMLPEGVVMLMIQITVIISELSLIPLYFFFVAVCTVYTQCCKAYNIHLHEIIQTKIVNYPSKGETFDFDATFQELMKKEILFIDVLKELDRAFSIFLASLLLGNSAMLASVIAQGFMRAVFATPLDAALFLGSLSNPIISLLTLITFATILHETSLESKSLWTSLVANRQFCRGKKFDSEEGEKLLTILHITESRPHSLSVIRTVNMERGFGITLVMGFFGFVCFLIERSENFKAQVDLVMGALNATMS
ncbi:uncharacterized protein LOC129591318 [Paramacrobiotus metropolitanus]|uniref:uncharacterized protein LOC129591318 n=1 Tax=Paramacrobiotus metropolitanus TaxID=2943436 RepID=UPI002445A21B|nr:uncharacterized protein LOC129591318 [Paramacrobiotus metropolitanus]